MSEAISDMLYDAGSVRCAVAHQMSPTPVLFLLIASLTSNTAAPVNTTLSATDSDTKTASDKVSVSRYDPQAILVISITFPSAFIVGILWCYCMTSVFGIRSGSKSSLTTARVPPSNLSSSSTSDSSSESSVT